MVNELFLQVAVGEGGFRGSALEIAAIWFFRQNCKTSKGVMGNHAL